MKTTEKGRKEKSVQVRMSLCEHARLRIAADAEGCTISEWVRAAARERARQVLPPCVPTKESA